MASVWKPFDNVPNKGVLVIKLHSQTLLTLNTLFGIIETIFGGYAKYRNVEQVLAISIYIYTKA